MDTPAPTSAQAMALAVYRQTLADYAASEATDLDVAHAAETLHALGLEWSDIDALTDDGVA